jgi:hypothetical protein
MLTSLSLAAGCVDAVGYLGLGQVFVANMTGNTVLLGLAIGQADGRGVLHAGTAPPAPPCVPKSTNGRLRRRVELSRMSSSRHQASFAVRPTTTQWPSS